MGVELERHKDVDAPSAPAELEVREVGPARDTAAGAASTARTSCVIVDKPGGHCDQMLRQTRVQHMQLSYLADLKANMLITVSAIGIPVLLAVMSNARLRVAAGVMIAGCVVTCCFAVLSSMPGLLRPKRDPAKRSRLFNPLFFGDFTSMSYDEFAGEMQEILSDPSLNYEAQVREIYGIGMYLQHRKYKYLRWAYGALVITMTLSILVWLLGVLQSEGLAPAIEGVMPLEERTAE